jgi:hypothetical protein
MIHAFLLEGEEELHDQVYDAVRAVIEQKPHRAGVGPWRELSVNKFLAIGLGAAAVVAVLLIGSNLLGSGSPAPGGAPAASEAPSEPAPSTSPTGAAEGSLPVGAPFVWSDGSGDAVPVTVTPPAPGWSGETGWFALGMNQDSGPPNEVYVLLFSTGTAWTVPGDACHMESTLPDTPSATIDELVAAFSAQTPGDASEPVDITVDGHAGQSITLRVPSDVDFADCDFGSYCLFLDPGIDAPLVDACARPLQGPGQVEELWIVEVDGNLVVIDAASWEETPAELVDEQHAMIDSITFE